MAEPETVTENFLFKSVKINIKQIEKFNFTKYILENSGN